MAKGEDSHFEMADVRQRDGISVIFDQNSPASSRSRSPPRIGRRSSRHRGRGTHGRRYRSSSSSSSSSRSSSNTRSRSHPRCHRPSSRCRCDNHRRNGRDRHPRSRPSSRRHRRSVSRFSQSPPRTHKSVSRSGSSEHSVNLNLDDKELLKTAKANATTILAVEKLELPERILAVEKLELPDCVKPILSEQSDFKWVSSDTWVRQDPGKTQSQSNEGEFDMSSPTMSPKMKISFSINNSVVKQTVAASSCAKVTSRVDIYASRKPYGHWIPVQSAKTSKARKHRPATSH
ncbi:arginine/serine-rich protein 1 [Etheostoma spectabile]|uniref:arginine/serine-rich protein 1 n=1 Tax=Etheostoma spectabile TaxID=54343 RepID=UPI0013AF9804|nr:arginine/serine-rich protein 1-like [Etheostoma spectabile]